MKAITDYCPSENGAPAGMELKEGDILRVYRLTDGQYTRCIDYRQADVCMGQEIVPDMYRAPVNYWRGGSVP